MKELIIIGGGAAGITAGIYAARKYLDTLLIAKDFTGQVGVSAWIENYPGMKRIAGLDLVKNFKEHLEMFDNIGIKSFETVIKIEKIANGYKVITDEGAYEASAVIIAAGSAPKKLNAENENKFLGKGLSYCVTCDETAFKDKPTAVIGGGNAGAEAALELARICPKVYVLEYQNALAADKILQAAMAKTGKIEIITAADVKAFSGTDNLETIVYAERETKARKEIKISGCFIEIGGLPNTGFANGFLELNEKNEIKVNPKTLETGQPGVFAAGDVTDLPYKQIVIACGQGALAALSAHKYLKKIFKII